MKTSKSDTFSKATITKDEDTGHFIIEEVTKDASYTFDLTDKLEEWIGVEGVSLSIKRDLIVEE